MTSMVVELGRPTPVTAFIYAAQKLYTNGPPASRRPGVSQPVNSMM
jgi:hypothetical protein